MQNILKQESSCASSELAKWSSAVGGHFEGTGHTTQLASKCRLALQMEAEVCKSSDIQGVVEVWFLEKAISNY